MPLVQCSKEFLDFIKNLVGEPKQADTKTTVFVGGLMKSYQGSFYLSGNAACRWYFNPQIPEAREFYTSFHNQRLEIRSVAAPAQQQSHTCVPAHLEEKNLSDLNIIDPYDFSQNGYHCTVTIARLLPNASCVPCSNMSFKFKYKVCFTARDGTGEAEMVAFGDVARCMIGKPVQQLLRTTSST